MSNDRNDGGSAFPCQPQWWDPDEMEYRPGDWVPGMTLRDYMAVHSTQPGCMEICKCAGVGFDGSRVFTKADDQVGMRFDDWFRSLSLERACELSALVRYAQADAMLKAREA